MTSRRANACWPGSSWRRRRSRRASGRSIDVDFTVDESLVQDLEFRFLADPGAPVSFDTIAFDVDYGLEVVDPIDRLTSIDTRASIFDAHPNERAHEVLAEVLAEAIEHGGR